MTTEPNKPASHEEFTALSIDRMSELISELDPTALSLAFSVIRLANRMVADLEAEVHSPAGWSWAGFRIMFAVHVCGDLEPREISLVSDVSRASVSSVLNTLERDGLVVRLRESEDRRLVTVRLTDLGSKKLVAAFADHHDREKLWTSALTPSEREQFTGLVRKMLASGPGSASVIKGVGQKEWAGP